MRLLFLGDIVGRAGRTVVCDALARSHQALRDSISSSSTAKIPPAASASPKRSSPTCIDAGADCVTLGNHAFDQKDTLVFIERHDRLIRPLNYPKGTPGKGATLLKAKSGADVLVINAMGRVFMPDLDCPFRAIDAELTACALKSGADAILIDFHAEATSEKQALGLFSRRPRQRRDRHPHAHADGRRARAARWHGLHVGCRHVRRLQFRARHGKRRADQPLPDKNPARALRAGRRPGNDFGVAVDIDDATRPCDARSAAASRAASGNLPSLKSPAAPGEA